MPAVRIVRIAESRRNVTTIYARVPSPVLRFLLELDARVVDAAKTNVDAWFANNLSAQLVEEYYRGSSASDRQEGCVLARFVVEGRMPPALSVQGGEQPRSPMQLALTLSGIQFRRQYFACVWKSAEATPCSTQAAAEFDKARARPRSCVPLFSDDDQDEFDDQEEEDLEEDDEELDEGPPYPTAEECAKLRQALVARIMTEQSATDQRSATLQQFTRTLDESPLEDLHILDQVAEQLDALLCPQNAAAQADQ
jgi:hypothetical protein